MRNPLKSDESVSLGLLLARLPMGLFFLVAGVKKLHGGVNGFVETFQSYIPHWAPPEAGVRYLQLVPYLEVAVGAMLVLGLLTRLAGLIGALMVISYMVAVTGVRDPQLPFHPNMIYLGVLLTLFFAGPGKLSLDGFLFAKRPRPVAPA
jgi:putative oxidoreductase